jgi:vacuolar-type H+-ATPase subunit I/STV1
MIKRPKKIKEYNFVKIEQVNQLKEEILKKIKEQEDNFLNIERFINNKIDDYQKQIDKLKENKDTKFSIRNIIIYILVAIYLTSFFIIMKILS